MSSSVLHQCPSCGQITDISTSLAAFIENPHCSQCGLSSSESGLKLQEDLAALFDKQMNMGTIEPPENPEPPSPVSSSQSSPITYSITQHYHHSSHVAKQAGPAPMTLATNDTLRSHGIDPSTLSSRQIELFECAIPEQKSRLIQIWQICPERSSAQQTEMSTTEPYSYNNPHQPLPVEDHDMGDMAQEATGDDNGHYAEPYMLSGYETLARRDYELSAPKTTNEPTTGTPYRLASDPVYQSQRWWEHMDPSMEHQYGAFEQMSQY